MKVKMLLFSFAIASFLSFTSSAQTLKIAAKSPADLGISSVTATSWQVSGGLHTVGKGMKVYLKVDTAHANPVVPVGTTFEWQITGPEGSTVQLDSTGKISNSFTADAVGQYTVTATVGTTTLTKDIFASTFQGMKALWNSTNNGIENCAPCHLANGKLNKYESWSKTPHATIYKRGITGQLEVDPHGYGAYGDFCKKCHTTGWEENIDNGNFGYEAKATNWKSQWVMDAEMHDGEAFIPAGEMKRWTELAENNAYNSVEGVATIGCESCHGPAKDHLSDPTNPVKIAVSLDAGVCAPCHDAPAKHQLYSIWEKSTHSNLETSIHGAERTSCYPCHSGGAFVKFAKNPTAPGYNLAEDMENHSINCSTCHDPHNPENKGLRMLNYDKLRTGIAIPADKGGYGKLCINCHQARTVSETVVKNQEKKFGDRFYPHYSPQADVFFGVNGIEYGLPIKGMTTHANLDNGCVTCHMSDVTNGPSLHSNHQMRMTDDNGEDIVTSCQTCHGSKITSFGDVGKGSKDYDMDGDWNEGVQKEVQDMMDQLYELLPKNAMGEVPTMAVDSMVVKNHPNYPHVLKAMYNYQIVAHDFSNGVHNTDYTVALLRASLNQLTGVELTEGLETIIPQEYALEQNYPNPFNPSTTIRFSIPTSGNVTLKVYDIVGKEVATLHQGELAAGTYNFKWNASNMASGIYFYKLSSDNFNQVKKMVLMK